MKFALDFAAFVGSATLCAILTVATLTSACQAARVGYGSGKVSQVRDNGLESRPQDGLGQPVNTGRHIGGKRLDLHRATRGVAGSSPDFERSSSPLHNVVALGEAGMASARGAAHPNTKEAGHEEVLPADMNLLQEKSTDGERVASAPKAINRAADRAFNSATRAPRLVGLVNAGRDLGAMRPSHLRVTLGRDRDFERESPTPYRITRSARPVRDGGGAAPSYTPQVALSRGVHHEPAAAALPGGRGGAYLRFARVAAHLCGVDEPILFELISRESSWRQTGADGRTLRSRSGALGLTQIKASTARDVSPSLDPHDAAQNLIAGACYLRQQFDRFGSWRKALHAYHAGPWRRTTTRATLAYASDIITKGSAQ